MEKNSIERPSKIEKGRLDPLCYTVSLLGEACRVQLLDNEGAMEIQGAVMAFLGEEILRYTKGESASVSEETAGRILQSILFTLDCALRPLHPEDALDLLQSTPLSALHSRGRKQIDKAVGDSKALYEAVLRSRVKTDLIAYNDTLDKGICDFFKVYGPDFSAHEASAGIDYPLAEDAETQTGVLYIKRYLESLETENRFCSYYSEAETGWLLSNLEKQYQTEYRELLINLFELHFQNALLAALYGKSALEIRFSAGEAAALAGSLRGVSREETGGRVVKAKEKVIRELDIKDDGLKAYLERFLSRFLPKLFSALEENTLTTLLIAEPAEERKTETFDPGVKMPDTLFRAVVSRLQRCNDRKEKAEIIRRSARGLQDFCDLLGADCLYGGEYAAVYQSLADRELAVLLVFAFPTEFRSGKGVSAVFHRSETGEPEWKKELRAFCGGLSAGRMEIISAFTEKMRGA